MAKKVCLDAGHGGKDSGAVGYGRKEKDDVLKMVLSVGKILAKAGISVYYTRTTDIYESPTAKAMEANRYGVDFFASFHRNAANGSATGFETLVYANSGAAKICADKANAAMAALGFKNRGTKIRRDLAVLNTTRMQAVLFEIGFIDNQGDNNLFDKKFDQIAQGLASAVAAAVGVTISGGGSKPKEPEKAKPKQVPGSAKNNIGLKYRSHVQDLGTLSWVHDGQVSGTTGFSLRLEGLQIDVAALKKVKGYEKVQINAIAHVQDVGDVKYENIDSKTWIGTTGESKRLEGLELECSGLPKGKELKFQVHEQNKGWSSVAVADKLGAFRGSIGEKRRIEAVKMWIE